MPGSISSHSNRAMAATKSSTIMPAAPTVARCEVCRNADAAEASTYGMGINTSSITPISWTSPPQALVAQAWPNSCRSLSTGKVNHMITRFCGASAWEVMSSVSSRQCDAPANNAVPTTAHQRQAPNQPNNGRYQGNQRSRALSGSNNGMRIDSGDIRFCSHVLRVERFALRISSARSGVTSVCSTSEECNWPSNRIISSCVGASSPNFVMALSQIS